MPLLYNIDFELASIAYMVVINVYLRQRYSNKSKVNHEFQRLALFVLITNILDVATAVTISFGSVIPPWFNLLFNTAYLGMIVSVGFQYLRYVVSYVYPDRVCASYRINRIITIGCFLCMLANLFTGHIFSFNWQGTYIHGPLYLLLYAIPYYFMIYSTGIMICNHALFDRKLKQSIAFFFVVGLTGPTIQFFLFPHVLLSVFTITLGVTLIMFSLETPDYQLLLKTMGELDDLQKNLQAEVLRQTEKADRLSRQALETLAITIDAKDKYTNGHSIRVAEYASEIAKRSGMTPRKQQEIYYIGLLHDIGKIGIPDSIINKASFLTDDEYARITAHPTIGADILKNISSEIPGLETGARWHHERYDGNGYPDGLVGNAIPVEARIIGVADAYDAMTSERSYRGVLPQTAVRAELIDKRGKQFDPAFADIMVQMIDEDRDYRMRFSRGSEQSPLPRVSASQTPTGS